MKKNPQQYKQALSNLQNCLQRSINGDQKKLPVSTNIFLHCFKIGLKSESDPISWESTVGISLSEKYFFMKIR